MLYNTFKYSGTRLRSCQNHIGMPIIPGINTTGATHYKALVPQYSYYLNTNINLKVQVYMIHSPTKLQQQSPSYNIAHHPTWLQSYKGHRHTAFKGTDTPLFYRATV